MDWGWSIEEFDTPLASPVMTLIVGIWRPDDDNADDSEDRCIDYILCNTL